LLIAVNGASDPVEGKLKVHAGEQKLAGVFIVLDGKHPGCSTIVKTAWGGKATVS